METIIKEITQDENQNKFIYEKASEILNNGGLVAFPTETVYGLGGNALDKEAAKKIYQAKGRPSDNPLIVHIAEFEDLDLLVEEVPMAAKKLIKAFWPGPLTIILKKSEKVPYDTSGGLDTVAIRMPSHLVARKIIKNSGVFVAAPSANISGRPSPTKAKYVIEDLNGRVDMIVCDDTVEIGLESTIVDLSEEKPLILRPGYITLEMIKEILPEADLDEALKNNMKLADHVVAKAPGMKYRHYAPKAGITVVEGAMDKVVQYIIQNTNEKIKEGYKVGIMTTEENIDKFSVGVIKNLGLRSNKASIAKNLFSVLREFDDENVDYIFSEGFENESIGQAVMNRLVKAAGYNIVKV